VLRADRGLRLALGARFEQPTPSTFAEVGILRVLVSATQRICPA